MMLRCTRCVMPNTRPDTPFIEGVCSACLSYDKRKTTDWGGRKAELLALLDRHDGKCIVPSSGGKDSHWQALTLKELGADVTAVTATTCYLTPIGRRNIDNLAKHVRTIEVSPNKTVRAKLNRIALNLVGDISWPEHASIFSVPLRMANHLNIPLVFYGENPQEAYGGPPGSDEAKIMTRRWVTEFGGFLGLRPADFVGMEGITERDMADYEPPKETIAEAHFLGQYLGWDSGRNSEFAEYYGMGSEMPCPANYWSSENLDNAQTGLHDFFGWLKYGYGRGCAQISVDVRRGWVSREDALTWVEDHDGLFPREYCGVPYGEVLRQIGMSNYELDTLCKRFDAH